MKKPLSICFLLAFVVFISSPVFCAQPVSPKDTINKLQSEIVSLQKKLQTTKNKKQADRIQNTINGNKAKIAELKKDIANSQGNVKLEITKISVSQVKPLNPLQLKLGFAGGAILLAGQYSLAQIPADIEAGYAIGNGFGVIDLGISAKRNFDKNFIGGEFTLASYSQKVQDVPGISGTIDGTHLGVGVSAGTTIGSFLVGVGYNTALGIRADATYRLP